MKKIIAITLTLCLAFSIPVFAEETTSAQTAPTEQTTTTSTTPEAQPASDTTNTTSTTTDTTTAPAPTTTTAGDTVTTIPVDATTTQEAGVTPDSIFYSLDRLMEKIQLALVTDAVKQAELLAKIAQERLAESIEMASKTDTDLAQKALEDYKASLDQSVTLIQTAMEQGKQVATVMDGINAENLKDTATVDKILASIPEQYRDKAKAEIEKITADADATNETAQTVENKDADENSIKLDITMKYIEGKIQDPALLVKIKDAGLNTRQIIAIISLSEQSQKPLGDVIDLFIANKGIGATAHALGLKTKDALKGINSSFKDAKETIKKAFDEAIKSVDQENQAAVQAAVNNSLTSTDAAQANAEVKAANEKLQKVIADAKAQVAAITSASISKNGEKKMEKAEKAIEKAQEKAEKAIEKASEKHDKDDKAKIEKDRHNDNNDRNSDNDDNDEHDDVDED